MEFDTVWAWLLEAAKVSAGALGMLLLGFMKARNDSKKVRTGDRQNFTQQLMDRLQQVEGRLNTERDHYERLLKTQSERYQAIIDELTTRVEDLERLNDTPRRVK